MKKYILLLLLIGSSCVYTTDFIPYTGTREILGTGGLYIGTVHYEKAYRENCSGLNKLHQVDVCKQMRKGEYSSDFVDMYSRGLPENRKCLFVGTIYSNYGSHAALRAMTLGANVLTKSDITIADSFEQKGTLLIDSEAGGIYTIRDGHEILTGTVYNAFQCK